MVEAGGPTLPRRFLETLRVAPIPPGAKAREIWRIVLQKCNTSLDRVIAEYESRLDALVEREKAFIESLPRLKPDVTVEADEIVIRLEPATSGNEKAKLICMYERDRMLSKLPEPINMTGPGQFVCPEPVLPATRFACWLAGIVLKANIRFMNLGKRSS